MDVDLKTFKERMEYIRNRVSGYGMLCVPVINDVVHTGDIDEMRVALLYNKGTFKSGTIDLRS